ncbi:transcriptional regulator [Roseovarius sp. A46]|uniref:helix-turn-helix transcriptional regulator n=1 Tax=Roseovarius sp. A46 TaxID=2109331 RepID=UPI001011D788|nr:transcriptional regulator [Roseovarius sp. A46]
MTKFFDLNDLLRQDPNGARIVPVSKATLYRMIAEGRFPKPKRLGKRSVWTDQEIQQWREQWLGGSDG